MCSDVLLRIDAGVLILGVGNILSTGLLTLGVTFGVTLCSDVLSLWIDAGVLIFGVGNILETGLLTLGVTLDVTLVS